MCAIIGYVSTKPDWDLVRRLFLESSVRGLHATGAVWYKQGKLHMAKEPLPAAEFLLRHPPEEWQDEDGSLRFIAHCRYSTSDLEWNQPFLRKDGSRGLVHNGVVSQAPPETWEDTYGVRTEGRNDSELLLHSDDPWEQFPDASVAVCELLADGTLLAYRNGKRPAYFSPLRDRGYAITSTLDIARRCGLPTANRLVPGQCLNLTLTSVEITQQALIEEQIPQVA